MNDYPTKHKKEIVDYAILNSNKAACEKYGLSIETIKRYRRYYNDDKLLHLEHIKDKYSVAELKAIASGTLPGKISSPKLIYTNNYIKIGFITDTHFGSKYFNEGWYDSALNEFERQNVDLILHTGDIVDGMDMSKHGHIYELTHLGFDEQLEYAKFQLSKTSKQIYVIDGNHDRWFVKAAGANPVKQLGNILENVTYLGSDWGTLPINDITVMLWHGEDGNSYAISYRVQKIIESLQGGEKPNLLLCGHTHKYTQLFDRNIHIISGGCLQRQTPHLRSKRIQVHPCFHIIELELDSGIKQIRTSLFPFYK